MIEKRSALVLTDRERHRAIATSPESAPDARGAIEQEQQS
jgi:hypothetical protein